MASGEWPELIEGLVQKQKAGEIAPKVFRTSAAILFEGTETTATLLCGLTYLLLTHRDVLERVTQEVLASSETEADVTLMSV